MWLHCNFACPSFPVVLGTFLNIEHNLWFMNLKFSCFVQGNKRNLSILINHLFVKMNHRPDTAHYLVWTWAQGCVPLVTTVWVAILNVAWSHQANLHPRWAAKSLSVTFFCVLFKKKKKQMLTKLLLKWCELKKKGVIVQTQKLFSKIILQEYKTLEL